MKKRLSIIIIGFFVFVMGTMGAGFYILWNKVSPPDPQVELEEEKTPEEEEKVVERPVHTLDTFVVNLSDRGTAKYLRTTLALQLTGEEAVVEIGSRLSQIRDAVLMIIPAKKSEDIITIKGKKALGDEIMTELNYLLKNGSITNIFFTEFVIQ